MTQKGERTPGARSTKDDIYPQLGMDSSSFGLILDTGAVPPALGDPPRFLKLNSTQMPISKP
jgi:hypothetical protein